MPTLHGVPE